MIQATIDKFNHHKVRLWSFMEQAKLCLSQLSNITFIISHSITTIFDSEGDIGGTGFFTICDIQKKCTGRNGKQIYQKKNKMESKESRLNVHS